MKRHIFLYLLLAAGTLSCEKESLFPQVSPAGTETPVPAATGTVSISLGGPFAATRVANPAGSVETTCNRWALWIFDGDGDSVVYGTGLSGESIRKTVLVGSYTVVALVNYPESLVPAEIQRKTDLTGWVTSLSDNAAGSMLMYGEVPVDLEKDRTVTRTVDVRRLVSKVGVKKVSVAFENPYLAAKTTVALDDLPPFTEIAHADPFAPTLPLSMGQKNKLDDRVNKHIYVFERGSQMDLLSLNPNTFMWASPVPQRMLDQFNLVQRTCPENDRKYRDMLIFKKSYALTSLDKAFIDELVTVKRELGSKE